MDNSLSEFSKALEERSERKRKETQEWSDKLGEPDFYSIDGDVRIDFYRVEGGVVSFRRYPNGVLEPYSRVQYTEDFINQLHSLLEKEKRPLR